MNNDSVQSEVTETQEIFAEERKKETYEKGEVDSIKNQTKVVTTPKVIEQFEEKDAVKAVPEKKKPAPQKMKKPRPKKYAQISFDSVVHHLPSIVEGDRFKHKFIFTNNGNAPLVIDNVKASCGCTRPVFPFLDIAPGEQGEIGVTYDSYGKTGQQEPKLTVFSNAKNKTLELKMVFVVEEKAIKKDSL